MNCLTTVSSPRIQTESPNTIRCAKNGCPVDGSVPSDTLMSKNEQQPHPTLEYPLLYHALKRFWPTTMENICSLYVTRWFISYPLRRNVAFSQSLLRIGVHLTWGELLILLPLFTAIILGLILTVRYPSISGTGKVARAALISAMVLAQRNSFVTLLVGMPVDRAIVYHKLAGKIAGISGTLHTAAFFLDPAFSRVYGYDMLAVAFKGQINASGSVMMLLLAGICLSSQKQVRRRLFEAFYYLHFVFIVGLVVGAFFHSGILVPSLALLTWGVDLFIRKVFMARLWNPRVAHLSVISDTVVQVSFPKTDDFAYNPGQYIYLAVPEISCFQWHPFSISSAPHQEIVTLHIRNVGNWTSSLWDLAAKNKAIEIYLEGPFGNLSVDIIGDRKYKTVMLLSGGIGLTPMQSIYDQLVHEASHHGRDLRCLKFIWIERDPVLISERDLARHQEARQDPSPVVHWDSERSLAQESGCLSSRLLAAFPPGMSTDVELNEEYSQDFSSSMYPDQEDLELPDPLDFSKNTMPSSQVATVLDVQIYLTGKQTTPDCLSLPGVRLGRPNIKQLFLEMKKQALAVGECKVAVCVSAPRKLMTLARQACVLYSDESVRFDLHFESMAI